MKKLGLKGQGVVMGAVTVAILIMIGLYVFSTVGTSIDRDGFSTAQNTTFDSINTNTESGLTLGSILPLVLFAGAIIGALVGSRLLRG